MDLSYRRVDPEVRSNTAAALDIFRNLGCQVREVDLGWSSDIDTVCVHWFNIMWSGRTLVDLLERSPGAFAEGLKPAARDAQREHAR